jgi:hypothetical protein
MNIKLFLMIASSLLIFTINCFYPLSAQTHHITQSSPASVASSVQNTVSTQNDKDLKPNERENQGNASVETPIPNPDTTEHEIPVLEERNETDIKQEAAVIEAQTPIPNFDTTAPEITIEEGKNEADIKPEAVIEAQTPIPNPDTTAPEIKIDEGKNEADIKPEAVIEAQPPIPNPDTTAPEITIDEGKNDADIKPEAVIEAPPPIPNPDTTAPEIDEKINEADVEDATVIEEEEIDEADLEENLDESEDKADLEENLDELEEGIFFFDEDLEEDEIENEPHIQGFILQHRIDKGIELSQDETEGELWILLQTLKDVIVTTRLEQSASKPLRIDTVIEILLSEYLTRLIETDLPVLSARTKINRAGKGRTIFKLPDFYYQNGDDVLTWTGFKSRLSFTDKFDNFQAMLKIADFHFDEEYELLSISKMKLTGIFDADLFLKQVELNLPFLKIEDEEGELEIQNLVFNLNMKQSHKGIEIGYFTLTIGQLSLDDGISTVQLHQMVLTGSGEAQNDVLNYTLQAQISQGTIASLPDDTLKMSFQSTLELRRIDLDAMKEWQTSVRELKKQRQQGNISQDIMIMGQLFKLNEILPKLLVKSPELAIPQLYINSKAGHTQGQLLFSIDGTKAAIITKTTNWLPVLKAQLELNIGKQWLTNLLIHSAYHTLRQEAEAPAETQDVENDTLTEADEEETEADETEEEYETEAESAEEPNAEENLLTEEETEADETEAESAEEPNSEENILTEEETEADETEAESAEEPNTEENILTEDETEADETEKESAEEPNAEENLLTEEETEADETEEEYETEAESAAEPNTEEKILTEEELAELQTQAKAKGEEQLKQYVEQKWLVNADADNYNILLSLSDNQLTVNGHEQPLVLENFTLLEAYFEEEEEEADEEAEDELEEAENELLLVDDFEDDEVDRSHSKPEDGVVDDFESEEVDRSHPKSKEAFVNEPLETDVLEEEELESLEPDSKTEMNKDDNVDEHQILVEERSLNSDSKAEGVAKPRESESFENPELKKQGFQAE